MSVSGFDPSRTVLGNGLTVLHLRNPSTAAVTLSLTLPGGAVFESEGRAGLATLTARGLMRGTRRRDKQAIGEVLDFRGAHMAGAAGRHTAGASARARTEDFEAVLELLADVVREPQFPDDEVAKLKGDRITALREDDEDPAAVVVRTIRQLAYAPEHPYSRRLLGEEDTVQRLSAADLRAFHCQHYRASAALLVIVGDLERQRAFAAAEAAFGTWEGRAEDAGYRAARPQVADAPVIGPSRRAVTLSDRAQVDLAIGHAGIRREHPRYWDAALLNMVLGRFAMGGRLGRSVREEQGMAYYTYSSLDAGLGPGLFVARAGVAAEHVEPAISSMRAELERIRAAPVEEQELDDAKAATVRSLPRTLESNEGLAGILHRIELFDLGFDWLERFPAIVAQVSPRSVHEAAREILHPDRCAVAIAGPWTEPTES